VQFGNDRIAGLNFYQSFIWLKAANDQLTIKQADDKARPTIEMLVTLAVTRS
jgi:hypothetical protein